MAVLIGGGLHWVLGAGVFARYVAYFIFQESLFRLGGSSTVFLSGPLGWSRTALREAVELLQQQSVTSSTLQNTNADFINHTDTNRSFGPYSSGLCQIPPLILHFAHYIGCGSTNGGDHHNSSTTTSVGYNRGDHLLFLLIVLVDVTTTLCLARFAERSQQEFHRRKLTNERASAGINSGTTSTGDARDTDTPRRRCKPNDAVDREINSAAQVASNGVAHSSSSGRECLNLTGLVAAVYLLNPITILGNLTLSLFNVRYLCVATALLFASSTVRGSSIISAAATGVFMYCNPLIAGGLIVPLSIMSHYWRKDRTEEDKDYCNPLSKLSSREFIRVLPRALQFVLYVMISASLCHYASYKLRGNSMDYLESTLWNVIYQKDVSPSLSPYWYFNTLVFTRFASYFNWLFVLLPYTAISLLVILFVRSPLVCAVGAVAVMLLFDAYPAALDLAFIMALLLIHFEAATLMETYVFWTTIAAFGCIGFPIMLNMWLQRNTGNANFCFAFQLVYFVGCGNLVSHWLKAALNIERLKLAETKF